MRTKLVLTSDVCIQLLSKHSKERTDELVSNMISYYGKNGIVELNDDEIISYTLHTLPNINLEYDLQNIVQCDKLIATH